MNGHMTMTDDHRTDRSDHGSEKQIERFRAHLIREEKSGGTVEKYLRDVRSFFHFLPDIRVTKEQTLAWKEHPDRRRIRGGHRQFHAGLAQQFSPVSGPDGMLRQASAPPAAYLPRPRPGTVEGGIPAAPEGGGTGGKAKVVLHSSDDQCHRHPHLRTALHHGAVSENARAEVDCKGKQRVVLLTEKLCRALRGYCRETGISSGPVFVTKNGNPVDRSNIWTEMKRLCSAAGVEAKKVFPHNLRHLFARGLLRLNRDIAKLADLLGHLSIDTTRIYIMESGPGT